jgi:uncharacterized protein YoxC
MVWEVALVVLLLVLTVFILLLIPTVLSLYKTLGKFSKTLDELNKELPQILNNVGEITNQTSQASRTLNGVVDNIAEFEHKVSEEIKEPALEVIATLGGLFSGIQTFMTYFIRKKK